MDVVDKGRGNDIASKGRSSRIILDLVEMRSWTMVGREQVGGRGDRRG